MFVKVEPVVTGPNPAIDQLIELRVVVLPESLGKRRRFLLRHPLYVGSNPLTLASAAPSLEAIGAGGPEVVCFDDFIVELSAFLGGPAIFLGPAWLMGFLQRAPHFESLKIGGWVDLPPFVDYNSIVGP